MLERLRHRLFLFPLFIVIKIYVAWMILFETGPSARILLTEIPAILITYCVVEYVVKKHKLAWYLAIDLIMTILFFALVIYYKHFGVIATYHVLTQAKQVGAVKKSIFSVIEPQYLLFFLDIVIVAFFAFLKPKTREWKPLSMKIVASVACFSVLLCALSVIPNRSSFNENVKASKMGILNYEMYNLLSPKKEEIISPDQITQSAIDDLKNKVTVVEPTLHGAASGKNLIIIQMESFQNFLIGLNIDGTEITPNMNRLAGSSYYFPKFYQQIGQGNTSDAEFIVNTSYYVPPDGAATQVYGKKDLPSLPKLLQKQGYTTMNFHTNEVGFWNRDDLYQAIGYDRYYDKQFFKDEDAFFYGSSDEVLYLKTAEELASYQNQGTPFYAHVISMSSHNPFTIPEEKYKMTLPERYEGTFVGDYIRAENYADYALGLFIEDLKKRGIWENSVVVIYGDHRGLPLFSLKADDKHLMTEILGHEYSEKELINIPLIIASEGVTTPKVQSQLGGQIDILPTVANLLGVSLTDYIHFGQDLLNQTAYNLLPQRYYLPTGSFVNNEELYMSGKGFEDGNYFTLAGNANEHQSATEDEFNHALRLLQLSDSYVSQLPDRVEPE
ncbi:Lipoteichoic acid synthase 1 [Paenibacillus allorhizoplanae]|uniref:Lipoteichoic acid synthase 1 n=1 Tax=Paenibacillus allorhizoplanae TaxID=2905648 RepID=A0ABN8FWP7_9BACL|nr:LTA synthase family protein [Paenibacillus allorhizoplanae]CAH1191488.1 Lipoteichoic acid synthase 1 [Paenibacillus allorhizoplanae]